VGFVPQVKDPKTSGYEIIGLDNGGVQLKKK